MKKNKMLRMASVLLVLTLLTTSIIGGTFAKYVTTDSATDTARVAKFGVVATVSGDLFGSTYSKKDEGNTIITYSTNGGTVSADAEGTKVVAPGTKNEKGLTLSVAGTPEVSTMVTLGDAKDTADSDIYLAAGTYGVMVEYTGALTKDNIGDYYTLNDNTYSTATAVPTDPTDKVYELRDVVTVADGYYPLKWTVDIHGTTTTTVTKAEDVKNAFTTEFGNKTFDPNKPNDLFATVTWEWPFEEGADDDTKKVRDAKDTILGDMMAESAVVKKNAGSYDKVTYRKEKAATGFANEVVNAYAGSAKVACLTAAFGASLTVEQVD